MRNLLSILITSIVAVFTINYLVLAWNEPTASPPNDNVAAPLNVGGGRQTKVGDITLNNLTATSITLGGDTRFAWSAGGGVGCAWQGKKCSCRDVEDVWIGGRIGGTDSVRVVMGAICTAGVLTDVGMVSVTSEPCPNPNNSNGRQKIEVWGCDYYTR